MHISVTANDLAVICLIFVSKFLRVSWNLNGSGREPVEVVITWCCVLALSHVINEVKIIFKDIEMILVTFTTHLNLSKQGPLSLLKTWWVCTLLDVSCVSRWQSFLLGGYIYIATLLYFVQIPCVCFHYSVIQLILIVFVFIITSSHGMLSIIIYWMI